MYLNMWRLQRAREWHSTIQQQRRKCVTYSMCFLASSLYLCMPPRRLFRWLKPGGRLLFTDYCKGAGQTPSEGFEVGLLLSCCHGKPGAAIQRPAAAVWSGLHINATTGMFSQTQRTLRLFSCVSVRTCGSSPSVRERPASPPESVPICSLLCMPECLLAVSGLRGPTQVPPGQLP